MRRLTFGLLVCVIAAQAAPAHADRLLPRSTPQPLGEAEEVGGRVYLSLVGAAAGAAAQPADARLARARRSRAGRGGRIVLGPLMGFLLATAGSAGVAVSFNGACGNGYNLDLDGVEGKCLFGMVVTNLVVSTFLAPAGVVWAGSWSDGLGTYGSALLGSIGGVGAVFTGLNNSGEESNFPLGVAISSIIAPITAEIFYEFKASVVERRYVREAGLRIGPAVTPTADGAGATLGIVLSGW